MSLAILRGVVSRGAAACLLAVAALGTSVAGCNICEEGAQCSGDGDASGAAASRNQAQQCLNYCDRLNICGAPQASDLDACVKACEARFERSPEQTAALCACIPDSRCEDAVEGRCTEQSSSGGSAGTSPNSGSGGSTATHATGGSTASGGSANPSSGGSSTTGGSSHSTGGSTATGGSANPSSGGSSTTGGSSHGGASGSGGSSAGVGAAGNGSAAAPCGGTAGDGTDPSSGGADVGSAGAAPGVACTCDCQCAAPELCVDGYCSTSG